MIVVEQSSPSVSPVPNAPSNGKHISWEAFKRDYLTREDGFKYEWLNGEVEKSKKTMDYTQFFIQDNLITFFNLLKVQGKVNGQLIAEGDIFFVKNHRKPDLAYVSKAQISQAALGINPEPEFVIEIISTTDGINRVYKKMQNYRAAQVKVVWMIYPLLNEIHIHFGDNLDTMKIFTGDQICSAEPVLLDFNISVNDILKK